MYKNIFMILYIKKSDWKFMIGIYNQRMFHIEDVRVFLCEFNYGNQFASINIVIFLEK